MPARVIPRVGPSPFETKWWDNPIKAKPPRPRLFKQKKAFAKGDIERLREEDERQRMGIEDDLSRGPVWQHLSQRLRQLDPSEAKDLIKVLNKTLRGCFTDWVPCVPP
jgi:hypothetical protein